MSGPLLMLAPLCHLQYQINWEGLQKPCSCFIAQFLENSCMDNTGKRLLFPSSDPSIVPYADISVAETMGILWKGVMETSPFPSPHCQCKERLVCPCICLFLPYLTICSLISLKDCQLLGCLKKNLLLLTMSY